MSNIDWSALAEPFPEHEIKWLPKITTKKDRQSGKRINIEKGGQRVAGCLAHIDARMVMERLDAIAGPDGWSDRTELVAVGNMVMATCHLTVAGVTKSDTGPAMPANDENAAKEAVSGALKRAAVKFGIGRHLYDLDTRWLPFDGYKVIEPKRQPTGPKKKADPPKRNKTREVIEAAAATVHYTDVGPEGPNWAKATLPRFIEYCIDTIERYDNEHAVRNALKLLSFDTWPVKGENVAGQREAMYVDLKQYASFRMAGMSQDDALTALRNELMEPVAG